MRHGKNSAGLAGPRIQFQAPRLIKGISAGNGKLEGDEQWPLWLTREEHKKLAGTGRAVKSTGTSSKGMGLSGGPRLCKHHPRGTEPQGQEWGSLQQQPPLFFPLPLPFPLLEEAAEPGAGFSHQRAAKDWQKHPGAAVPHTEGGKHHTLVTGKKEKSALS